MLGLALWSEWAVKWRYFVWKRRQVDVSFNPMIGACIIHRQKYARDSRIQVRRGQSSIDKA